MNHFFAYLSRLNHIYRWSLMRNTFSENVAEHTAQVAFIAHGIATIGNIRYGRGYDVGYIAQLALFHDVGEVLTGDLATPIKYQNEEIKTAYNQVPYFLDTEESIAYIQEENEKMMAYADYFK